MRYLLLVASITGLASAGCMTATQHQATLASTKEREMTLGVAQREVKSGMSQADVAVALGSPNIVTKDGEGKETWVYDKIATEVSYSQSSAGAGVGGAFTGIILGGVGTASMSSGAASSTQKTLTVVIKFDAASRVESMTYHSSKF